MFAGAGVRRDTKRKSRSLPAINRLWILVETVAAIPGRGDEGERIRKRHVVHIDTSTCAQIIRPPDDAYGHIRDVVNRPASIRPPSAITCQHCQALLHC